MEKILIAEDNKEISSLLKLALEKDRFSVDIVEGGYPLLAYLRDKQEPDAIILDLFMPDRSGIELVNSLISKWTKTKIFIFSGQKEYAKNYLLKNTSIRGFFGKRMVLIILLPR